MATGIMVPPTTRFARLEQRTTALSWALGLLVLFVGVWLAVTAWQWPRTRESDRALASRVDRLERAVAAVDGDVALADDGGEVAELSDRVDELEGKLADVEQVASKVERDVEAERYVGGEDGRGALERRLAAVEARVDQLESAALLLAR